ncbi:conserved hypothetical protein [Burkholderiales bacterium 8X]|nr:conserved hypothetical protein [Burkholderiales bacterium 8X]
MVTPQDIEGLGSNMEDSASSGSKRPGPGGRLRAVSAVALLALSAALAGCGGGGGGGGGGGADASAALLLATINGRPADAGSGAAPAAPSSATDAGTTPTLGPSGTDLSPARRAAMLEVFRTQLIPAFDEPVVWTGSTASCLAGQTSPELKAAELFVINYYRELAGLPAVSLHLENSIGAQQAALMMRAEGALSHEPPPSWACYTPAGALAAARSNIALGYTGAAALQAYMEDEGHPQLGHRRWLLYSRLRDVGLGDTESSNAVWVVGTSLPGAPAEVLARGIPWPPSGFVPIGDRVVRPTSLWSFGYPGADFTGASVAMANDRGAPLAISYQALQPGTGDETIAWSLASPEGEWSRLPADTRFSVSLGNVRVGSEMRSFRYDVVFVTP